MPLAAPVPRSIAAWILSAGMLTSRAFWTASRSRKLPSASPPPSLAAIVISRLALVKACPRLASTTAFLCLMPAHFEWPDMASSVLRTCFRGFYLDSVRRHPHGRGTPRPYISLSPDDADAHQVPLARSQDVSVTES